MTSSRRCGSEWTRDSLSRRNNDLRGWWRGLIGEMDGGPSTIGKMTGPTEDQQHCLERMQQQFDRTISTLDQVIRARIPELNQIMADAGLEPVQVPQRGSGPGVPDFDRGGGG